ncbi:MAG TPA: serine/threonine-protein kinase [Actinomycetota bacterium]
MDVQERTKESWEFEEGQEIAPGLHALDPLGGGWRYEVYLAWDDRLFTVVAAKLLRPDRAGERRAMDRFRVEAEAAQRLQHPVLPRCFGVDLEGEHPHIVLEYMEGPRLSSLIRKQKALAIEQVIPLALQICSALHYMSVERVVHLDVKPKNIIMGAPPRLIDLSIAAPLERAREIEGPIGTDAYMAPEQCEEGPHPRIDYRTDMWGLGVTMYESISGRLPYPRGEEEAAGDDRFPQIVVEPEPLPREIPSVLADPVMSCLRHDPEERPTAAELAEILQPLADALPRNPRLGRRRPRLA